MNLVRADLACANLAGSDLSYSDLRGVCLAGANLEGANLRGARLLSANLHMANLQDADLSNSDSRGVDFSEACLRGANLRNANLIGSNMPSVDLSFADLTMSSLRCVDLSGATLTGSCLDPRAEVLHVEDEIIEESGLKARNGFVYGWRTKKSSLAEDYKIGREYAAPWFSVCSKTPCHPGIYFSSLVWLESEFPGHEFVKVRCLRQEIIHCEGRWRAKRVGVIR